MKRPGILLGVAILLTGLWHLATIRSGQDWGDDFALYISHARNLSAGEDYADTGYIYNPAYPTYSPRTYPPVYPLLLAPVYRLCGLSYDAMKIEQVLFVVLLMIVVYFSTRRELPPAYAGCLAVLLGLSPVLWVYKDRVMSEIPFMLFCCLALSLLDAEPEPQAWRRLGRGILAGAAIYLACGTRAIGIVLVPSALAADVLGATGGIGSRRWRLPGLGSWAMLAAFAGCVLAQRSLLVLEGSYLDQWSIDPAAPFRCLSAMVNGLNEHLPSSRHWALFLAALLPATGLFLLGYASCLRRRVGAREVFFPLYLLAIVAWMLGAYTTPRFLLPVLPLVLVYLAHGAQRLAELAGQRWGRQVALGLGGSVLAVYALLYSRFDYGPLRHGVHRPEAQGLFAHIREQTPPDAVVVFSKARVLSLLTGRRASPAQTPAPDPEVWAHLQRIGATHFVVGRPFPESDDFLQAFADRHPDRLQEVYHNPLFTVYQVRSTSQAARDHRSGREAPPRNPGSAS